MTLLLQTLRSNCHVLHEALHVHPLLAPLISPNIVLDDFSSAIRAFYLSYQGIHVANEYDGFPDSPVLEWLRRDMEFHGITVVAPEKKRVLRFNTLSQYVGFLYVKQGSTLGGQAISKYLNAHLKLEPAIGNSFFYGYGSDTGNQWKRFVAEVAAMESTLCEEEAVEAAIGTFQSITYHCDRVFDMKNV